MYGQLSLSTAVQKKFVAPELRNDQKTILHTLEFSGIGLHSGKNVNMRIDPAPINTGIIFIRSDLNEKIKARWDNVTDTRMCTRITNENGVSISTIEHLMAALAGYEIHNAYITVDGPELPIMDGSSAIFFNCLQQTGIRNQNYQLPVLKILKNITIQTDDGYASLSPADNFLLDIEFDFKGRLPMVQKYFFDWDNDDFGKELAKARTFGMYEDAQKLINAGLAQGASLENTLVIHHGQILNEDGFRFQDEFVRHKMLDAIGDLALANAYICGKFSAFNPSHTLTNNLLRKLFSDKYNFILI